jgi:hypothetical protein
VTRVVAMSSAFSGSDVPPGLLPMPSMQKPLTLLPCYRSSKRWRGPMRHGRVNPFEEAPYCYQSSVDPIKQDAP